MYSPRAMAVTWVIGDRLTVRLEGTDKALQRHLDTQLDPYAATPSSDAPDLVIERASQDSRPRFLDLQNPAGDGLVTAADGEQVYVVHPTGWCRVEVGTEGRTTRFTYGPGLEPGRVFASLGRPALQLALLRHGAVAVHSAAVEVSGTGVLIAGWSESGKTETALALMEAGARFLSDKWTILGEDRTLTCFPIGVGVRRWALRYLPQLRRALPAAARAQLLGAGVAAGMARPLRRLSGRGRVIDLAIDAAESAVRLADRAALQPSELIDAYGQREGWVPRSPLGVVVMLRTVPGMQVSAREVDPQSVAPRLARSAAFERRRLFELCQRALFAMPTYEALDVEAIVEREAAILRDVLSDARVVEVDAPFPTDPRRVVEAIGSWL